MEFFVPFLSHQKSTKKKFSVSQEFSVSGVQSPEVHGLNQTGGWPGGVFPPEDLFKLSVQDRHPAPKSPSSRTLPSSSPMRVALLSVPYTHQQSWLTSCC